MTIRAPLDPYSLVVNDKRQWTPEWYTWLADLISSLSSVTGTVGGLQFPTTGDAKLTLKNVADAGWIMMDDGTIGKAGSGATTLSGPEAQPLFTLLWNNISDVYAPVSGGRGSTPASDFTAGKVIALTRQLGRSLTIGGLGSGLTNRPLGSFDGAETHAMTIAEMPSHTHVATTVAHNHSISTGGHSHGISTGGHSHSISTGSHSHTIGGGGALPLALTTTNIQGAGGSDRMTVDSSTSAGTDAVGDLGGGTDFVGDLGGGTTAVGDLGGTTSTAGNLGGTTSAQGGGAAMSLLNPRAYWNVMIKL